MSRLALVLVMMLCPILTTCITAMRTEIGPITIRPEFKSLANLKRICIQSIDFYADKEFTKPAKKHWYMDTTRDETIRLAKGAFQENGYKFVDKCTKTNKELHARIALCIKGALTGVVLYMKATVYHNGKFVCEVPGYGESPAIESKIKEMQVELSEKLVKEFLEKIKDK